MGEVPLLDNFGIHCVKCSLSLVYPKLPHKICVVMLTICLLFLPQTCTVSVITCEICKCREN